MKNHKERKHSTLGASHSERWLNCPGSVALSKDAPPQAEGAAAKAGTLAHEKLERVLKRNVKNPKKAIDWGEDEFDPEIEQVIKYVLKNSEGKDVLIETKVELGFIDPELFGTLDIAIVERFGVLEIIDFKNGFNPVGAEGNTQLIYYGLGIAYKYDFDFSEIKLTIAQPKVGKPDSWSMKGDELESYIEIFKRGVARTKDPKAKLFANDKWCRYCPASLTCPERNKTAMEVAKLDFDDLENSEIELPHPKDLSPERIGQILSVARRLESWVKDVETYAIDLIQRGGKVKGYFLEPKRPQRVWSIGEKGIAQKFAKYCEPFETKVLTPAQMEKAKLKKGVKREELKKLIQVHTASVSNGVNIKEITNEF